MAGRSELPDEPICCPAGLDPAEIVATLSALSAIVPAAALPLLAPTAGRAALPALLEAVEEKKLRNALAGCSALLLLVGGCALLDMLGSAEAGRFMNALHELLS